MEFRPARDAADAFVQFLRLPTASGNQGLFAIPSPRPSSDMSSELRDDFDARDALPRSKAMRDARDLAQ